MASHSSILAWKIPWTKEPGGSQSPWGRIELDTICERLSTKKMVTSSRPKGANRGHGVPRAQREKSLRTGAGTGAGA